MHTGIDFNRLKVFYHIYKEQSIVKAAANLHLSQPALSQHLKKLEEELKVQLFTRAHKHLVPTSAAQQLFKVVAPFVQELDHSIEKLRSPYLVPTGSVRIGTPREFGKTYLPQVCNRFRMRYPEVNLKVVMQGPTRVKELLGEGGIDLAIVDIHSTREQDFSGSNKFDITPIAGEELILACSEEYYQARLFEDESFDNLVSAEFLSDEEDHRIIKDWFWHHHGYKIREMNVVTTVINSHQALIDCIRLGMGLGVTASHLVWEDLQQGNIIAIQGIERKMITQVSLLQLKNKKQSVAEKVFLEFLRNELQNITKRF